MTELIPQEVYDAVLKLDRPGLEIKYVVFDEAERLRWHNLLGIALDDIVVSPPIPPKPKPVRVPNREMRRHPRG